MVIDEVIKKAGLDWGLYGLTVAKRCLNPLRGAAGE
jgi:hypothetical protein